MITARAIGYSYTPPQNPGGLHIRTCNIASGGDEHSRKSEKLKVGLCVSKAAMFKKIQSAI